MKVGGLTAIVALVALCCAGSAQAALRAPALQAPAASASIQSLPTFTWGAIKGAANYEFQLSDDAKFNSIVLGTGKGLGSQRTRNTAATVDRSVPDGNYFWRVRAISTKDRVGRWSSARAFTKAWKTAPTLVAPSDDFAVSWPSLPPLLRWAPVPHATKYRVTIGTDPSLAQLAGTPSNKPVEVPGISYALQGTLPAGRYYWAVTPLDAGGLPGSRSRVGSFTWNWPTATATRLIDLNDTAQVFDPLLNWDLVPGAARYEVEINPDDDFAAGSKVCCKDPVIGTSLSPVNILPNNNDVGGVGGYHWRVRAFDADGNPGQWNRGASFEKAYDAVTPTIPDLQLRTYAGTPLTPGTGTVTSAPLIAWSPVPGAVQYHLQWTNFDGVNCNWSGASGFVKTSSTAWTPLSPNAATGIPGSPTGVSLRSGIPYSGEASGSIMQLVAGTPYCVRVRALSDNSQPENGGSAAVISQWTQIGGSQNQPAFTWQAPATDNGAPIPAAPPTYREPLGGTVRRTPLLSWEPVPGARRYFVLIARDSNFTNVVDAAFTAMTAYMPNRVLQDEATSYFWAVIPTATVNGSGISGTAIDYNPQHFNKQSLPPALIEPVGGADVSTQPTFRWTPTEAAQKYRLQVSADPQFGDLLDDVITSSTAYTSSKPYPVDTVLYWRVRAEQLEVLSGSRVALSWSDVGTFRRRLPAPTLADDIPLAGELPPALSWTPVPGAISYDVHIDEADGDGRDFNVRSAVATFSKFFGIGTFKYKVRANFGASSGAVASAYSPQRAFTRVISPPNGRRISRTAGRLVFSWDPAPAATSYRVDVSSTESFSSIVESVRTNNTSWAPALVSAAYKKGPLYWRLATVDDGGNTGAFVSANVRPGKTMTVRVRGRLRRNATSRLIVSVRGSGRAVRSASVRAAGAGVRTTTKRTGKRGTTSLRLRPRRKGYVTITVRRSGFTTKTVRVRVR